MTIEESRKKLAEIDLQLLELLGDRFKFSDLIGQEKVKAEIPVSNNSLETDKIELLKKANNSESLGEDAVSAIWQTIFEESKKLQLKSRGN